MTAFVSYLRSSISVDTVIAFISMVIAFLTLKSAKRITRIIDEARIKEQHINNRSKISKLIIKFKKIVNDGIERPANSSSFNDNISQILGAMDRYFSLDENSKDYATFATIKAELEKHLSVKKVTDVEQDILMMKSTYGRLLGALEELNDNGRV